MSEWVDLISKIGFPMAMCGWFAFRLERVLERNVQTNDKILTILESIHRKEEV